MLGAGDEVVAEHLAQHEVAPLERRFRAADRIVIGRALGQGREEGAFGKRELADILVEIGARRRLHAISVPPQEDLVEIEFENLLLGERRLDPPRERMVVRPVAALEPNSVR